ncbi:uncharacterized protein LOC128298725 [Anopheles moucheti]|uniref:uncharacterized protein LOC128298725 n=1 Tax=Anopheles moucheti TaxID=186751 RepID=UPI0022EFD9D7|nr:uncharacterized protein LOC128298725 [Anopheles moucheti]
MENTPKRSRQSMVTNSYARELFFLHTNIMVVLEQMLPQYSETVAQNYAAQIYEDFVTKPRNPRIRKYIEAIRFDTRYAQGMFRLALKVPITSEQELRLYQHKLADGGIKQMFFVDMTRHNLVHEHKEKVVTVLKERFGNNWTRKLGKLPTYISRCQRVHEDADRRFLYRLKHHSSQKGGWLLRVPDVLEQLTREYRIPSEQRTNLIWPSLRFDSDYLNKKYSTGDYCRFQNDIQPSSCISPYQAQKPPTPSAEKSMDSNVFQVNKDFSAIDSTTSMGRIKDRVCEILSSDAMQINTDQIEERCLSCAEDGMDSK